MAQNFNIFPPKRFKWDKKNWTIEAIYRNWKINYFNIFQPIPKIWKPGPIYHWYSFIIPGNHHGHDSPEVCVQIGQHHFKFRFFVILICKMKRIRNTLNTQPVDAYGTWNTQEAPEISSGSFRWNCREDPAPEPFFHRLSESSNHLLELSGAQKGPGPMFLPETIPSGNLLRSYWFSHHAIKGKIHYFDWAIFNSYVTNYQRVHHPLNPIKPPFSYGFPMVFLWFSILPEDKKPFGSPWFTLGHLLEQYPKKLPGDSTDPWKPLSENHQRFVCRWPTMGFSENTWYTPINLSTSHAFSSSKYMIHIDTHPKIINGSW